MYRFEPIRLPASAEGRPLLIAGPCSAETEAQTLATARGLAAAGVGVFRAGLWKPRTKPGGFEGVGAAGLEWLARVRRETGMRVATEIATRSHAAAALDAGIDLVWVGARTASNPFAMQEIADALRGRDIPVLVKNPLSPDLDLWIGAIERLYRAGLRRLGAVHRGFTAAERSLYRNPPVWSVPIELRRRLPELPLLCDPSHIAGRRELVAPLAQQAMDLGFDGLMIEVHHTPDAAWSDAEQQLTPEAFAEAVRRLTLRRDTAPAERLESLRRAIDRTDDELMEVLARRMEIARKIGRCKREHGLRVLQAQRYGELLARREAQAEGLGLSGGFIRKLLQVVHEESVRQQLEGPEADDKP